MKITSLRDRGLVRLISATHHKPPVLRGLVDSDAEADILAEIEGMTSGRLLAERGQNLHLDRRELAFARRAHDLRVYGISHINAAFTYTRPTGNRFNDGTRGAWYCAWSVMTSIAEVGYHHSRELGYVGRYFDTVRYVELHADFIGDFPDLTGESGHPALGQDPALAYPEGQALALHLQRAGHRGLIYPSARAPKGRCLVVFEPSAIQNVRPGACWDLQWQGSAEFTVAGV